MGSALSLLALVSLSLLGRAGTRPAEDPPCEGCLSAPQEDYSENKNRDGENILLAESANDVETAGLLLH